MGLFFGAILIGLAGQVIMRWLVQSQGTRHMLAHCFEGKTRALLLRTDSAGLVAAMLVSLLWVLSGPNLVVIVLGIYEAWRLLSDPEAG